VRAAGLVAAAITTVTVSTAAAATTAVSTAAATAAVSTAAAAATTLVAATTAAATTTRAIFTGTGFVDLNGTTFHVGTVEFFDGCGCLFIGREGDKAEAARAAGLTVKGDHDIGHGAHLSEGVAKRVFGAAEGEIPHIEFVSHSVVCCAFLSGNKRSDQFPVDFTVPARKLTNVNSTRGRRFLT
jgi:hypothetical protein